MERFVAARFVSIRAATASAARGLDATFKFGSTDRSEFA